MKATIQVICTHTFARAEVKNQTDAEDLRRHLQAHLESVAADYVACWRGKTLYCPDSKVESAVTFVDLNW